MKMKLQKARLAAFCMAMYLFAAAAAQSAAAISIAPMRTDSSMPHYQQALALKKLGLFNGTDKGFELSRTATRVEASVMLVRLLGKEKEALSSNYPHPFKDVPPWASPIIGYMYRMGLTGGVSSDEFGSEQTVSAAQYITFILRAMDYSDKAGDFLWTESVNAAYDLGIIGDSDHRNYMSDSPFLRDDVVNISAKALDRGLKGQPKKRLINRLLEQGPVTREVAVSAGFDTAQGLYSVIEFGEINGISQINPEAFSMDLDKVVWRNKYNFLVKNIRIKIDSSKLSDNMKNFTKICLNRGWTGKIDKDSLSAFLSAGKMKFYSTNEYKKDDEGWIALFVGSTAYDVLALADNNNNILGYLAIRYHFDDDIPEYMDYSDRFRLVDKGAIDGMKPLGKISLTRDSLGALVVNFDNSEMPEAVYNTARPFSDQPHDSSYPDANRIEGSISDYANTFEQLFSKTNGGPVINAWKNNSSSYNIDGDWAKNLCLYVVYDKDFKAVGYAIIEKLKQLSH